jgi:hypothetical protein
MRKLFTLILVAVILQSCSPTFKLIPLKGKYDKPNTFYFDKSQDEVWNGLMKVMVQKGLSIKSFERASGVIFGDVTYAMPQTYEDDKGQLLYNDAYIVTEKVFDGTTTYVPYAVNAKWNILVYQQNSKTALYVNVFDIITNSRTQLYPLNIYYFGYYKAVSTGNFEKMIADSIKF